MNSYKNNFKIKVFSVIFAFFMWIYVMAEVDPIVIKTVENISISTIENMEEISSQGLTFSYGQNLLVKIDLRGKRSALNELINSGIHPVGSIDSPKVGENTMKLSFDVPREIEYSISPENLIVELEKSVIALKPVVVETTGIKDPNYVVGEIANSKNQVYVEGPQSQVDKVSNLKAIVEIGDNKGVFTSQAKLVPVDSKGNKVEGLTLSNSSIVSEITMEKTAFVPVEVIMEDEEGKTFQSKSLTVQGNQIKIQGEENLVNSIKSVKTKPISINIFNLLENKEFELEEIQGIKFENPKVLVTFIESELQNVVIKVKSEDLIFLGATEAEKIKEALPEEITLDIKTGKEYQSVVNLENVKVYIENVLESSTGEYKFSAKTSFPYSSIKINPSLIKIQP